MPDPIPAGTLVYGMQLPIQSQSTIYAEAWEADAGVDELAAIARARPTGPASATSPSATTSPSPSRSTRR